MLKFNKDITKIKPYFLEMRKYFHQNPELCGLEEKTSLKIQKELKDMKVDFKVVNDYSVIAFINPSKRGKAIAIRTGISGLPIAEDNAYPFPSKVNNVSHMRGSDIGMAMLLSIIKVIKEKDKLINGRLVFIFESNDLSIEGPNGILKTNVLGDLDYIFTIHNIPLLELGKYWIVRGPILVGSNTVKIKWYGLNSSTSFSQGVNDPLLAAATFTTNVRGMMTSYLSPLDIYNITVTEFKAGDNYNIVPSYCEMSVNVRYDNQNIKKTIHKGIRDYIKLMEQRFNVTAELLNIGDTPPLVNDEAAYELARYAVLKIVNPDGISEYSPKVNSESLSLYSSKYRVFAIGYGSGKKNETNNDYYTAKFNPDERSFDYALALYFQIIEEHFKKRRVI